MFCEMPKRKRSKELRLTVAPSVAAAGVAPAPTPRPESEQERAAKLFAESIRAHEAQDRAARERQAAAAERGRRHEAVVADKEEAAARLRRLRADGRPRGQMAEAEATYRAALAALTEFETGERPHWAPAPAVSASEDPGDDNEVNDNEVDDNEVDQPS